MSDSGWSDNEVVSKKHKKVKAREPKEKKRKRSNSIESFDLEESTKKKKPLKDNYENEPEIHSSYKKNPKKPREKDKGNKTTGRKEPVQVESDSEGVLKNSTSVKKSRADTKGKSTKSNYKSITSDDPYDNSAYEDEYKKKLEKRGKSKRDYDYKGNSSSRKQDKQSKDINRKSTKRNNRSQRTPDSDKETLLNDERKSSKRAHDYELEGKEERSRHYDKEYKKQSRNRHDDKFSESLDRDSSSLNGDDNSITSSNEKPYRYWSVSQKPIRKNSDSYWNKYSDRLKESTEPVEVGPRYYSANDNAKNEKNTRDTSKTKNRQPEKNDNTEKSIDKSIPEKKDQPEPAVQKKPVGLLTTRTGGAYIPPAKLRMMQESITDKASAAYQRLAWEALKKSIQGHVNKVNISNIRIIFKEILKENIVRGRGLLCRALVQAQAASPSFTNVYAALVSVLNAKFPKLGELLLKRLVVQFRRGFKRNDKTICITAATFIAHLVNQEVAHEIIALEMLTLLIETPTDDSVEVAIAFLKECGMKLTEVSSKGMMAIFDMLRNILHEGNLEKRVQYMIEVMFQVRKDDFKAHPSIGEGCDLVDEDDRIQHMITLEDNHDPEDILNVFKFDPDYEANEAKYKSLVNVDSDEESEEEGSSGSGDSDEESEEGDGAEEGGEGKGVIVDRTETNLVALRKTIYLTIQSSLDFEECAHKLLRMELKPGQEIEMAHMFLDCCAEQRTYEKFYGLLSQRFCQINRAYIGPFEETFRDSYETIHRMSNDKLRNVGKLFAHLLFTDAISWDVLSIIRLNEDDTTSSSRIFIKILFLELSEYMGLAKLNQRVKDPSLQTALEGLFPRDNPKHTRFAINFFTSIGLGGLTDELREHLKSQPKPSLAVPQLVEDLSSSSSSNSSSDSSDSSDSSSDSSSSDSSSSESEDSSSKKNVKGKQSSKKQPLKKIDKTKSLKKRKSPPPRRKRDR